MCAVCIFVSRWGQRAACQNSACAKLVGGRAFNTIPHMCLTTKVLLPTALHVGILWLAMSGLPYGGYFSQVLIFVESPRRASELIFVVLNFVTATSPGAWHCIRDDVIDTRA